jgi:hypothetical protein
LPRHVPGQLDAILHQGLKPGREDKMKYQVWYMRPETFALFGTTANPKDLAATHIHLNTIEADSLNDVYRACQGEVWSPNGEARELIEHLGLGHTSMSIGDIIVDDVGNAHVVAGLGFRAIGGVR